MLTLLINISVSSKWRPNILGDSPGTGSILIQTSWPLRAVSTCLWLYSIDVIMPTSKNCKRKWKFIYRFGFQWKKNKEISMFAIKEQGANTQNIYFYLCIYRFMCKKKNIIDYYKMTTTAAIWFDHMENTKNCVYVCVCASTQKCKIHQSHGTITRKQFEEIINGMTFKQNKWYDYSGERKTRIRDIIKTPKTNMETKCRITWRHHYIWWTFPFLENVQ